MLSRTPHPSKPRSPDMCDNAKRSIGSAEVDQDLPNRLRFAVVVEELAVWTRDLAVATRIMQGDRVPEPRTRSIAEPFWYSARSTPCAVVQTVPWSFHSPVCLLSECSPVGGRAGCRATGRRGAGPFPRFLGASGDIDLDAYVSNGHTRCRRSRIPRNSRWWIDSRIGPRLGRRRCGGV